MDLVLHLGTADLADRTGFGPRLAGVPDTSWTHLAAAPLYLPPADARRVLFDPRRRPPGSVRRAGLCGGYRGWPEKLAWFISPGPGLETPPGPGEVTGRWWAEATALYAADPFRLAEDAVAAVRSGPPGAHIPAPPDPVWAGRVPPGRYAAEVERGHWRGTTIPDGGDHEPGIG